MKWPLKKQNLWVLLILCIGCSNTATPPSISLVKPSSSQSLEISVLSLPDPCKGLKIAGELTVSDFKKLFNCLNKKGGLRSLEPVLFYDNENSALFVKLYNETFGNGQTRRDTLALIENLEKNGGLSDFLTFLSLFISEFIDTAHFDKSLKELLQSILSDDIDLMLFLKDIVSYPHIHELSQLLENSINNGTLTGHFISLGHFLRQNTNKELTQVMGDLSQDSLISEDFNLEDLYQLNFSKLPRELLEILYKHQMTSQLSLLTELTKTLVTRTTATVLTQERLGKLHENPSSLPQDQKEASLAVIQKHPANDLSAFVKLVSSLNRGFEEDETDQGRNLLFSLDSFVQGVKTAFDAEHSLGPDASATRVITIYSLFLNLSYQELISHEFHKLSLEEKLNSYISNSSSLYEKLILDYQVQKTREVLYTYKLTLEASSDPDNPNQPRYSPSEIRRLLRIREKEFKENELPVLLETYKTFLHAEISKAISLINTRPLFLNFTLYDFLVKLKENKESIALFAQKILLNLDNELLEKFIKEMIQGLLKDFFEFNRPVDQFLKSLDSQYSGSTWLSHTVDPLIHGFGDVLPMKDQITLISVIESYQAIERLLITENRIDELKRCFLPFLKAIHLTNQDERILKLFNKLHSGRFIQERSEEKEPITKLSKLIEKMISSGLFQNTLDLWAYFGKEGENINRFLEFLTRSRNKTEFLNYLQKQFFPSDPLLLKEKILHDIHTLSSPSNIPPLIAKLNLLSSPRKDALIYTAEHNLLFSSTYPLTPFFQTLGFLAKEHSQALELFLDQWGNFLTPLHIQLFESFIKKYMHISKASSKESFFIQLIKQDKLKPFLDTLRRMLSENTFQDANLFVKELIDKEELKNALQLLVKLLTIQESYK